MSFEPPATTTRLLGRPTAFFDEHIYPHEKERAAFDGDPTNTVMVWPQLADLKSREQGLWNLFLPHEHGDVGPGLTNREYAPLAEVMGRVSCSSEVLDCSAPDTGNMEVLAKYGSEVELQLSRATGGLAVGEYVKASSSCGVDRRQQVRHDLPEARKHARSVI